MNAPARGFTLVELLVVITIIALLASLSLAALAKTREAGKAAATKATVDKLNDLVMRKYESYLTRRLPINLSMQKLSPQVYAMLRMQAIRDLMRMEMPERWCDVTAGPLPLTAGITLPKPALWQIYNAKYTNPTAYGMQTPATDHQQAKCLYMWVMTAIPEAKGSFGGSEIADVDGDGWKCFVDGWGNPIGFLRWAPGATAWSDIQINDTPGNNGGLNMHHDPFDPNFAEASAYHLYPLIFAGVLGKVTVGSNTIDDYGIVLGNGLLSGDCNVTAPTIDPFGATYSGTPSVGSILSNGGVPLVHNHHMPQS